jgi:cell division septum initiation protein DivIVA
MVYTSSQSLCGGAIMQRRDSSNGKGGNGANGTPSSADTLHLGGRVIKKVELGLDEKEVQAYIDELITQRDTLLKRQEHLSALAELAEKTVIEANNLAQQMKQKATEQAKAEADKIRVKAEQDVEQMTKEKKAEAKAAAEKEADIVLTEALRQAELARAEQLVAFKAEAKGLAQKVQSELLTSIDNIKQHVMTLDVNVEQMSSLSYPVTRTAPGTIEDKPAPALSIGEKSTSFDQIPWLEVEVLPPVDIGKIMDLIARLESLPQVKTTDLLPEMPNPLIRVFLNEPSPLADLLRTLPQIEKVTEMSDSQAIDGLDIPAGDKRERIQIVLGKNSNTKKDMGGKKGTIAQAIS